MWHATDTIAAIATAPGTSGIGIVRVSGTTAFALARRLTARAELESHRIYHCVLSDEGEALDDAVVLPYRAPHSYTGEDVVELCCHGGTAVLRSVLNACLRHGARLAEPGEFTQRAFLNGRIDLAQAEAVSDLIQAATEAQRRLAVRQQSGALSRAVTAIADDVVGVLAHIEATIDFTDEIGELDYDSVILQLQEIDGRIERLLVGSEQGRMVREGLRVAIVGRPNVGKSSLMNALLGHNRAIVTAIPGTTRDVVEDTINLDGIPVTLADTAGVRQTEDEIETIGIERTHRSAREADLVLQVFDATDPMGPQLPIEAMGVLNKIDLAPSAVMPNTVRVSALTGEGLDDLRSAIKNAAIGGVTLESISVSNARHAEALRAAKTHLTHVLESLAAKMPPDFAAVDLRGALDSLGLITGRNVSDDLIERIFRDFCIGK